MSRFDEEPDGDIHGECAAEIARLRAKCEAIRQVCNHMDDMAQHIEPLQVYDFADELREIIGLPQKDINCGEPIGSAGCDMEKRWETQLRRKGAN